MIYYLRFKKGKKKDFKKAYFLNRKRIRNDGTPYLHVAVGNLSLGYYEEGDDIYLITEDGDVYAAERLIEEEAEALHSIVTE